MSQWRNKYPETSENCKSKLTGCSKSSSKWEIHSNKFPTLKTRKIPNKLSNFTSQGTIKGRTNNTQIQQKEGNKNQSRNK